jgi:hypothetical protein
MRWLILMATKEEHPERYGWWLNELESLGISANKINELNDLNEISSLAENIKRGFYQKYESRTATIKPNQSLINSKDW